MSRQDRGHKKRPNANEQKANFNNPTNLKGSRYSDKRSGKVAPDHGSEGMQREPRGGEGPEEQ